MPAAQFGRLHHLPAAQIEAVVDGLRHRGLVADDGWFTEQGRAVKRRVEELTDDLAAKPYEVLDRRGARRAGAPPGADRGAPARRPGLSRPEDVGTIGVMADVEGDFTLTMAELRAVARFVAESADEVLDVFERVTPGDDRPREAIAAARAFVDGAPRSRRQRVAALDAHRAAAEASTELARLAARCAGDAAAAAYLHPIARASQVGHILRAAATVARLAELGDDVEPEAAARSLERSRLRPHRCWSTCCGATRDRRRARVDPGWRS